MKKSLQTHFWPLALIFGAAVLLILPQWSSKGMILGSDAIFHYNRFYDAAMQIKEGNFQHFISMYGFQQTGRVINALYGPLFAYVQGLLVLISPSWFGYQVLSRLFIFCLSGLSMYLFLQKGQLKKSLSCTGAIFYMTTFSIQYWTLRQGFSSWGAAILPLCLLPIIDLAERHSFNWLQLGILTALMFQTHIFSSFILILLYSFFFIYALIQTPQKGQLIRKLLQAISLFILLTLTIWISFFVIYSGNTIAEPFINLHMENATITRNAVDWLRTPLFLALMFLLQGFCSFRFWKKYPPLVQLMTVATLFFLVLSTNLIPWEHLEGKEIQLINLIQFPFRFFVPATILLIFIFSYTLQHFSPRSYYQPAMLLAVSCLSLGQAIQISSEPMQQWSSGEKMIQSRRMHQLVLAKDKNELREAAYTSDLKQLLGLIEKSTPDYLPIYHNDQQNNYNLYEKYVLANNASFRKYVKDRQLYIEWQGKDEQPLNVPVINYHGTQLSLNGQELSADQLQTTKIGTIKIPQKIGKNQLILSFANNQLMVFPLSISLASWVFACFYLYKQRHQK